MRTINLKGQKFSIGKKVVIKKPYISGNINLIQGNVGIITGISTCTLADMGLFDIKVYDINFFSCTVSFGEMIMKEYVDPLL